MSFLVLALGALMTVRAHVALGAHAAQLQAREIALRAAQADLEALRSGGQATPAPPGFAIDRTSTPAEGLPATWVAVEVRGNGEQLTLRTLVPTGPTLAR